jgi:CRP/FNR family transcriptional regulator, cyclic AMP receptor protein
LYLISSGQVALEILIPHQGPLQIEAVGPRDVIACSWAVAPYKWHFDARAIQDVSALILNGQILRQQCDNDRLLGYEVLKRLAPFVELRLQKTRLRILELHSH